MDEQAQINAEAAAFRTLIAHFQNRTDVQNIDLMILSGFCRNCLSRWYQQGAQAQGVELSKDEARSHVYGMDYAEWSKRYKQEESAEKMAEYQRSISKNPPH
ncbi:MAG: DUF1244 domain-containing protein [Alphaproteobacteria bacterium]